MSPERHLSPLSFKFLSYSFFPFHITSQFSCIFPEMVDKLILLDSSPFALDYNVRTGLSCMLSLGRRRFREGPEP